MFLADSITSSDDLKNGRTIALRHTYIADCLAWTGIVHSSDVCATFGIKPQQAHRDFRRFMEDHPGSMRYDKHKQGWVKTALFPDELRHEVGVVLGRRPDLREILGFHSVSLAGTAWPPNKDSFLKAMVDARNKRTTIDVLYQSMSSPGPKWRPICPHSFFEDWTVGYVRGFCHDRGDFIDFRINRFQNVRSGRAPWRGPDGDIAWNSLSRIHLRAHPELGPSQRVACLEEMSLPSMGGFVSIRSSMLLYYLKHLGLLEAVQAGHGKPEVSKRYMCMNSAELIRFLPTPQPIK